MNYRFAVPEIAELVNDSRPVVFIAQAEFADATASLRADPRFSFVSRWLIIGGEGQDSFERLVAAAPRRDYEAEITETDPSWVCYTGGTTGRAKGVVLTHRCMAAACINFISTCNIGPHDAYFVAGAMFHVALVVPVAFWLVGAKVVLANFEPRRSLSLISREGVTQLVATGTIFKMLVEEMETRPQPTKLRLIYCGGAPVSPQLVSRARNVFACEVAQIYGQTEISLMGTYLYPEDYQRGLNAPEDSVERRRINSVGRAAPLCALRIVDDQMRPLPAGAVGEIAMAGDAVMQEYADRPELTAETLRDGWLRSGDLGFMDEEGYVYLVDRKKDIIISGGENVYSSEVELVLVRHPDISEAVVIGVPDDHWGEAVMALVVPREGKQVALEDVRRFCRNYLAGYKIPKHLELRESFPRLPTGKIAKGVLREPYWASQDRRIHGT